MYFIVLSVGAYALLLSSFITIVILLRKKFKQWMNTSLYILSSSDVLFSILTASILLINYMETYKENWDNTIFLNNILWHEAEWKDQFIKFHEIRDIINENNFGITPACNTMQIIMQYGMFLIPFTNSFISLLMFFIQCNLNVFNLKNQCSKSFKLKEYIEENNEMNKSDIRNIENCETIEHKKVPFNLKSKLMKFYKSKFLEVFQMKENKRNNKIIVMIFVINQWIIPIVVTGLLYLMKHDSGNYTDNIEKAECFKGSDLFFENCHDTLTVMNAVENYSDLNPIQKYKDYINDVELMNTININNTQINEVIYKIQSIMYSSLHDTYNTSHYISNIETYNTTELLNTTKYLDLNSHAEILDDDDDDENKNNNVNNEWNSIEGSKLVTDYESAFNITSLGISNSLNNIQLKNNTKEYDEEILLFNYLMTNSSQNISIPEDNSKNKITVNITETLKSDIHVTGTLSTTEELMLETTTKDDTPIITNDEIYAEVLKRIHNTVYNRVKNNYNQEHTKKQPKLRNLQDFNYNYIINKPNLSSIIQFIADKTNDGSNITNIYVTDKCSIPLQFLKVHLLLLLFIIYFLPILFCIILHQHGKLNCQLVLIKLRTKDQIPSNTSNDVFSNNINNVSFEGSIESEEVLSSKQDNSNLKENTREVEENLITLEQIEIFHENFTEKRNEQHNVNECDQRRMELNVIIQAENILKLFDTIKMSLLCGIVLWTPIFFEVSFKIFAQVFVPKWLLSITYLVAVAFGILRNFFNLRMIKLQDNNTSITKVNSIHPIV